MTVYSRDPAGTAKKWESMGAKVLHVVDLDGAFTGSQQNLNRIVEIRNVITSYSIQYTKLYDT